MCSFGDFVAISHEAVFPQITTPWLSGGAKASPKVLISWRLQVDVPTAMILKIEVPSYAGHDMS